MIRLLKAELLKVRKSVIFKVLCCIAVVLGLTVVFMSSDYVVEMINKSINDLPPGQREQVAMIVANQTSSVVEPGRLGFSMPSNTGAYSVFFIAFGAGIIEIFTGFIVGGMFAKEYTEGTLKNSLAYGRNRVQIYIIKFIAILIAITVIIAIMVGVGTLGTLIMNGWGVDMSISEVGRMALTSVASIIATASVVAILMIISTLVKSNGAVIGITAGVFAVFSTLISFFYGKNEIFDAIYKVTPFYNNAVAVSQIATVNEVLKSILISVVIILVAIGIGARIFKKQDIK